MKSVRVLVFVSTLGLTACAELPQLLNAGADVAGASGYSNQQQLVRGVKAALELGSSRAAEQLSTEGGYSNNSLYRIELPESVQAIANPLRKFGLGGQLDRIETLMNQGAEKAAVEAKTVLVDAVRNMTVNDALAIVRGNDSAATDYFRQQTEASLRTRYQPIIKQNLQKIGFYNQYQQLLSTYNSLPISNKPDLDLEQHVLNKSLAALFAQIAVEERAIRDDPIGRGSAIISSVFMNTK